MGKFAVTITATLPGSPQSRKISSTVKAKDAPSAVALVVSGIWSDRSRQKSVIWYRDYSRPTYPKGYYRSEKRLLISAIRSDAAEFPQATEFPPKWKNKKITITPVEELEPENQEPKPEKRRRPQQLGLFDKISVGSHQYKLAADPTADNEAPYGKLDPSKIDELSKVKVPAVSTYVKFYYIYSAKALSVLEATKPTNPKPEESDAWQAQVRTLRENDAWILSNRPAVTKKPLAAVIKEITVVDLPQMTARKVSGYVDGIVAYVPIESAFAGAAQATSPGGG